MDMAICGQGRLGSRVATLLSAFGHPITPLRLDAARGLLFPAPVRQRRLPCLILCLVPRHDGAGRASVGWRGLLDGLAAQVATQDIQIEHLVFVSSTRVYDGYGHGWVTADMPAKPQSEAGLALAEAESIASHLAPACTRVRLTGLYGPGYERYDPVLMSESQVRHGVDVRAAATVISRLALNRPQGCETALVTDGRVYFQGRQWLAEYDQPELSELALGQRLLLPSHVGVWPPARHGAV